MTKKQKCGYIEIAKLIWKLRKIIVDYGFDAGLDIHDTGTHSTQVFFCQNVLLEYSEFEKYRNEV